MKKILLYITFFCLDAYSMNTNNIRELMTELTKYQTLCNIIDRDVEGYFGIAACYVKEAIQVRKGKDSELSLNLLLDNATQNFLQARQNMSDPDDIDTYFSKNIYSENNTEYISFLSYLKSNNLTKCTVEDTKKAIWGCYLKNQLLDKEYYESLLAESNPIEKRKEGYFGLAAYYLNSVINDARGQTSLSETHNSNLKTASGNFIVAFRYLENTFDEVKKYEEVEEYFSQKIQFLDSEDIKVKHCDFGYAIQQEKLSISEITDDHIFKLMLKVYFGIDYKEGWGCLIM